MQYSAHLSFDTVFNSPVGRLGIVLDGSSLHTLRFVDGRTAIRPAVNASTRRIQQAILHYLESPGVLPSIPLSVEGTPFQRRVWAALQAIPAGQVMTYGELAAQLHSGARAVGNACRHNPTPLAVPCHRVVPSRGIGGFAGQVSGRLVAVKRQLLAREGVEIH
ncbi:methylated-DNA-[protein]-cysteine S-methyltransferase [Thiogranum longum]|uniref:Methylated-DNA-[protein]-cysteine S-methyltransferase n=1 Tax=Thiogranum longum TaxID=1537524 RepID=A0A4V2PH06_9GAMM|nr:methylated-DNA--[protein]-cysteine S-methyltransferase [Thiogranum longum]TCK18926.1 methylated-DNA-[protein]-cysteine S-methyltransferase [Thiogranum longum]